MIFANMSRIYLKDAISNDESSFKLLFFKNLIYISIMKNILNIILMRFLSGKESNHSRPILDCWVSILCWTVIFLFIFAPVTAKAMNLFNPQALGMSVFMTYQDDPNFGKSGIGPGFHFFLNYQNPSDTYFCIGSGFYTITDDILQMDQFKTTIFPSLEMLYGKYLSKNRVWHPNFFGGLNVYAAFDKEKTRADYLSIGERYFQMSGFLGGGLEIQPNYLYSIQISADYRYVFAASRHNGRQFIVMRIGFLFYQ